MSFAISIEPSFLIFSRAICIINEGKAKPVINLLGERRYLACKQLGLAEIPAHVRRYIETKEDILTAQLIENLQREDIDPIDKANGILSLFKLRHSDMDLGAVINALMNYDRDPGRVKNEFTETVSVIMKSLSKTIRSIKNWLSLVKLPADIQSALKEGTFPSPKAIFSPPIWTARPS